MMQTYNPHYHIIVPSREVAVLLKKEWLKQWRPNDKSANKYKYTSPAAQDLRPVVNLEMALIEPIKYRVQLLAIPSNLGKGLIWYFICPHTGKRCRKLHLVGKYFYHRTACRGLYENQTKSKYYKILEKAMGGGYKSDQLFEQLYKKNFKKQYAGKPTKKYLKLTQQIQRVESIPAHEIERALLS